MGVLKGGATILTSEATYVYSEDEDVKGALPDALKGAGWVYADLVPERARDADVVTLAAMDPEQRNANRDRGAKFGPATAAHHALLCMVRQVEATDPDTKKRVKLRKPSEIRRWIDALCQQDWPAADLLSHVGSLMTIGTDVSAAHDYARRLLGYEKPVPAEEVADDDGASKSGGDTA